MSWSRSSTSSAGISSYISYSATMPRPPRSLPQQPTLDDLFDEEGGFLRTESLDDVRTNFWNNNDVKFQTSLKNLLTSLTDKSNNVIEMVSRVKEKMEPGEINFSEELKVFS